MPVETTWNVVDASRLIDFLFKQLHEFFDVGCLANVPNQRLASRPRPDEATTIEAQARRLEEQFLVAYKNELISKTQKQ